MARRARWEVRGDTEKREVERWELGGGRGGGSRRSGNKLIKESENDAFINGK